MSGKRKGKTKKKGVNAAVIRRIKQEMELIHNLSMMFHMVSAQVLKVQYGWGDDQISEHSMLVTEGIRKVIDAGWTYRSQQMSEGIGELRVKGAKGEAPLPDPSD